MAALLTKFRIDFGDVVIISDVQKKADDQTKRLFHELIEPFKESSGSLMANTTG
jgi:hypothetical protein